jgi:ABC-type branched-subunit amino acid transport system ATPase component
METFFCTKNLCKNFGGVLAANNVNFEIEENGLRSVIGPNGAGKTTLINVITGRIPASSGVVMYRGQDITNKPPHELVKMGICRTFQITSIFLNLSVFENVRIARQAFCGGSLKIFSSRQSLKKVNEETWAILERLGLKDVAQLPAKNLAHGDQRILEVAIALAGNPKTLFLDEPTAGMSPTETEHIAQLVRNLADAFSVVLVEHDMDMVMAISDNVTVLHRGSIIAEGSPKAIQEDELVREAYLGEEE